MDKNRTVPIQKHTAPSQIPEDWAREIYEEYHTRFPGQSFERLHQRGGFGIEEALMLLVERCKRLSQTNSHS